MTLRFNEKVPLKKISLDRFKFMESLNLFGSNLGLMPGLGLYQMVEWFIGILITTRAVKLIKETFLYCCCRVLCTVYCVVAD